MCGVLPYCSLLPFPFIPAPLSPSTLGCSFVWDALLLRDSPLPLYAPLFSLPPLPVPSLTALFPSFPSPSASPLLSPPPHLQCSPFPFLASSLSFRGHFLIPPPTLHRLTPAAPALSHRPHIFVDFLALGWETTPVGGPDPVFWDRLLNQVRFFKRTGSTNVVLRRASTPE